MDNTPLISVIMPAFNAEKTIEQAIRSVLNQTYQNFELIIVDDCSNDRTLSIARALSGKDYRVRILMNKENLGVSQSRNNGVEDAKSDWIAFLDSDDMWLPEKLEKQVSAIFAEASGPICFTGSSFINDENQKYGYILTVPPYITYYDLLKQNLISCSSVLVKKESLLKHPMYNDPMIHEDYATWLKILKEEPYAIGINEPLLIYRLSKYGKSGNKLRAVQMQWRTYRHIGIRRNKAISFLTIYMLRNLRKYACIRKSLRRGEI